MPAARRYIMAECGSLQAALVEHANAWAAKFTDLLHRVAHKQVAALQGRLAGARTLLQEVCAPCSRSIRFQVQVIA